MKKYDPQIGKNKLTKYIPDIFLEYFEIVVKESYTYVLQKRVNEKIRTQMKQQVLRKYKHCYEVLDAAFEILGDMKDKSSWNVYQVAISSYLHDIGRFLELNHEGKYISDHGDSGYEKLKGDFRKDERLNKSLKQHQCDSKSILRVISRHNKYSYSGNDKYVYLCRDVDKLALLRNDKLQLGFVLDSDRFKGFNISGEAREDFLSAGKIKTVNTCTKADALLKTLSFFKQFHFDQTKKIVKREKLFEKWEGIFRRYVKGIDYFFDRKIKNLNVEYNIKKTFIQSI